MKRSIENTVKKGMLLFAATLLCTGCGSKNVLNSSENKLKSNVAADVGEEVNLQTVSRKEELKKDGEQAEIVNKAENIVQEAETGYPDREIREEYNDNEHTFEKMVMLNDKLYVDTGEISNTPRCGVMDFDFDSSVEQGVPTENHQTNFGTGYGGQYSTRENRIEICIDGVWHIFAYNENHLEGVSMRVLDHTDHSLTLEFTNDTENELTYGEYYLLEAFNEENAAWESVAIKNDVGFIDIAYIIESNGISRNSVDLATIYGNLLKGKYRIVKEINLYDNYTFMAEFDIVD